MFKQILAAHNIEMAFNLRVFLGEAVDLFLGQIAAEAGVEFTGKLITSC
jgi:hypothetical protein